MCRILPSILNICWFVIGPSAAPKSTVFSVIWRMTVPLGRRDDSGLDRAVRLRAVDRLVAWRELPVDRVGEESLDLQLHPIARRVREPDDVADAVGPAVAEVRVSHVRHGRVGLR